MMAEHAQRVGKYGFPQLHEEQLIPSQNVKGINYLLSTEDKSKCWFHCFNDDSQFQRLWNGFDRYLPQLKACAGIISPDFSLYRDYDEELLIWNCYKNRCMAYAMQEAGLKMIPTAGFADERTWPWCFDGLPHNSTVAVTTNGTLSDPEAQRIFVGGINALVCTLDPYAIVVCGKYPAWLDTKYPNVKIIHIPSYSQQWSSRRCA